MRLVLDPFRSEAPALAITLPFYAYIFALLLLGALLGGGAMWLTQGRWRRTARQRTHESAKWQAEADRLLRILRGRRA